MTGIPDPLTTSEHDVRDLDSFMLNVERLLASELVALGTPEQCWAALMLWCRAWKQLPGGSLPDDDRVLAKFSGAGSRWPKVRDIALRGFVRCSDGRLYHAVLCAEVRRAWAYKEKAKTRRDTDAERLRVWRGKRAKSDNETCDETTQETDVETRFVAEGTGQDRTKEKNLRKISDSSPMPREARPGAILTPQANGHNLKLTKKARWEQRVIEYINGHRQPQLAQEIILSYCNGEPYGKSEFEKADREMKARAQ